MLYLITIFLGAFLLFQIQPLMAKLILPYFGGGAAVWTACLLFFQAFLLLGYSYAHLISQIKKIKHQVSVHLLLLLSSISCLPIGINNVTVLTSNEQPLINILTLLTTSIGLPYILLAATGPLVQKWLTINQTNKLPYKLYSLSNFASLLALISFPFCFEILFASAQQVLYWSIGYGLYLISFILLALKVSQTPSLKLTEPLVTTANKPNKTTQTLWLLLSATGVMLLVSTTNAITQNIPPVPFLWILPLCLYLLTFIISFHSHKWYVRSYWLAFFTFTALIAIFMYFIGSQFDIISQLFIYSGILFAACMICHGELAQLKPNVAHLTWYYLLIALGGFLGSAFIAFIAPLIFQQFLEFPIAIIAVFILVACSLLTEQKKFSKLVSFNILSALICSVILSHLNNLYDKTEIMSTRNFYGILSVNDVSIDGKKQRRLIDGTVSHGTQSLAENEAHIPQSYYRENTGIALAISQLGKNSPLKAGFIGLGAGTLAAYGRTEDTYQFYELNPAVSQAANQYFSYIKNSPAKIDIMLGDGRVSLTKQLKEGNKQQFNLLVIDAFSGDSIPQHLLTVEALNIYWQHMTVDGVLAIHISNSHLNLLPLMRGLAIATSRQIRYFRTRSSNHTEHDTEWVWLTNNPKLLNNTLVKAYHSQWPEHSKKTVTWTDNYSSLFSVLK